MEATGEIDWDAEIGRVCEQALAGDDLAADLQARVSSRYAQALVYGSQYERAGQVSRDALAAAEASGDPQALMDALRARQLACCAPEGVAERAALAQRMLETAAATGSAWAEMWGRLWRIDTLFETGQLRAIQPELGDLGICLERVPGPIGSWHSLHCAATLAAATGRFTEAMRLAAESFAVFSDMGHPIAFGAYSVILGQVGHVHRVRPVRPGRAVHPPPGPVQAGRRGHHPRRGHGFPALTQALICLERGDRAGAEAAYANGGAGLVLDTHPGAAPVLLGARGCWSRSASAGQPDIEFLAAQFEPFRGQHVANGGGAGVYLGPVELPLGWPPPPWAAWTPRCRTCEPRPRSAMPTARVVMPCRPASSWPTAFTQRQARGTGTGRRRAGCRRG